MCKFDIRPGLRVLTPFGPGVIKSIRNIPHQNQPDAVVVFLDELVDRIDYLGTIFGIDQIVLAGED